MNILMLGRNATMLQMGSQPLMAAGHQVKTTLLDEEALDLALTGQYPALVFGMAVEHASRERIRSALADKNIRFLEPTGPADLAGMLQSLNT